MVLIVLESNSYNNKLTTYVHNSLWYEHVLKANNFGIKNTSFVQEAKVLASQPQSETNNKVVDNKPKSNECK